jgi:hypothetical protein
MANSELVKRFLGASERRYKNVDVPLIGQVRIRSLSNADIRAWREAIRTKSGSVEYATELLVAASVVDENGLRVFTDEDARSQLFADIDSAAFEVLGQQCRKHSNLDADPGWQAIVDDAKN